MASFENPLSGSKSESTGCNQNSQHSEKQRRTIDRRSIELADREWNELPYAMMQITATSDVGAKTHLFWQDQTLELGDIDLNLARSSINEDDPTYTVTYSVNELRRALIGRPSPEPSELHRTFTVHPSFQNGEIRWTAPGLSKPSNLSTRQLAEKLVNELLTRYSQDPRW